MVLLVNVIDDNFHLALPASALAFCKRRVRRQADDSLLRALLFDNHFRWRSVGDCVSRRRPGSSSSTAIQRNRGVWLGWLFPSLLNDLRLLILLEFLGCSRCAHRKWGWVGEPGLSCLLPRLDFLRRKDRAFRLDDWGWFWDRWRIQAVVEQVI